MPRAWLISPVIGTGTDDDPYRPQVFDRPGVEGDRLEAVIDADKSSTCLVGYDVADDSDMAKLGGEKLLAEADLDKAADRVAEASKLEALAREAKVGKAGTARQVLRRVGQTITPTFDERNYLGTSPAPATGSFVFDSMTDSNGKVMFKNGEQHVGETGATWTYFTAAGAGRNESKIYSNRLALASVVNADARAYASGTPASPDYSVACQIYGVTEAGRAGPLIRRTATGFYGARWEGGQLKIYVVGGSTTEKANYTTTVSGAHEIVLAASGENIRVYWDGTERLHVEDGTYKEAGTAGLWGYGNTETVGVHIDSFTATDAGGVENKLELSDSVKLSDSAAHGPTRLTADSLALGDALARAVTHAEADTLALSDSLARATGLSLSDAVVFADTLTHAAGLSLSDALTLAETLRDTATLPLADAITLVDEVVTELSEGAHLLTVEDSFVLTDAIRTITGRSFSDALVLSDAVAKGVSHTESDSFTLGDSSQRGVGKAIADAVMFSEGLARNVGRWITDTLGLTDAVEASVSRKRQVGTARGGASPAGGSAAAQMRSASARGEVKP